MGELQKRSRPREYKTKASNVVFPYSSFIPRSIFIALIRFFVFLFPWSRLRGWLLVFFKRMKTRRSRILENKLDYIRFVYRSYYPNIRILELFISIHLSIWIFRFDIKRKTIWECKKYPISLRLWECFQKCFIINIINIKH